MNDEPEKLAGKISMRYTECMPTPEERMFQEAVSALEKGELARSRDLLTRLLKLNQQNAQYWLYMSAVVETQKERIYCLKEVLRMDPDNPTAQVGLSMIGQMPPNPNLIIPMKVQKTNWQKKVQEQKLPSLITGNIWPKVLLYGGIGIGLVILVLGAIWLTTRVVVTPETAEARSRRLTVAALQPTQGATQTIASTPMPTTLYAGLKATYTPTPIYIKTPHPNIEAFGAGLRAYNMGSWEKMIDYMRQVQTMEPSAADISYLIGEGYRKLKRYSEALESYNDALRTNPQFAPAYVGRATILLMKPGQEDDARTDIEEAIRLDDQFAEAYLALAEVDLREGQPQIALEQAEKAASILAQSPLVSWYQGRAYLALEDFEPALQAADQALVWDVGFLDAYRLQGEVYRKMGEWEKSIQLNEKTPLNFKVSESGKFQLRIYKQGSEDYQKQDFYAYGWRTSNRQKIISMEWLLFARGF
ncbi:MAG: tetratricopeptide repeat protein [Anaerolineaceae bacterium]|nr:tetratricopeptide repeat protein [Anaerolineaceae bacterium]